MKTIIAFFASLIFYGNSFCQVKLPRLISDGMILQRDAKLKIWGWASANEAVKVTLKKSTVKTKADAAGNWSVQLPAQKAGGPYSIEIAASNKIVINNVLFGDVWFCSGQSNMVHNMELHGITYAKDIENANYPQIRQFLIPTATNLNGPQQDVNSGSWKAATPDAVQKFSAVAYFFARKIYEQYHIPVGIINSSVGGTPIEAWSSETGLKDFPEWMKIIKKNKDTAYIGQMNRAAANIRNIPSKDLGLSGNVTWFNTSYIPEGWRTINIPGYWEDQGIKDLNGVVWYRKIIDIPASMTGKAARVFLGRIVDADQLYINGNTIGGTTYQYPQRRYFVSPEVLHAGKNIFVIRVTNTYGKGGFVSDKPYYIFSGTDTVDLKGYWQYKVGEVFEPVPNPANVFMAISAQNQPASLFNGMVAPIINYAIKGVLWYQGEANSNRAGEYARLLPAMIADWRKQWQQENLPFLYVQLPGFMDMNYLPSESQWAELRQSQLKSLFVPNTGMAVAIDLGEWNDIHPDNKKAVGERLALLAEKNAYGENIIASGPLYQSSQKQGSAIAITFNNIGTGLTTNDGQLPQEFAIAGTDKKFVWAKTKIEGDKIIVWNDTILDPKYVRYAWADNPVNPNLYNKEGLPASPFTTEEK